MGALTDDAPKCLTHLGTKTLLERQVAALRKGGCDEIGIVTGYRADLVRAYADREFHNAAWASSNMVRSLATAREWLETDRVVVSYSDIFYEPGAVRNLAQAPGEIAIAYDQNWLALWSARFADPLSDAETFRLDESGWLREIGAKASDIAEIEGQYVGLIKIDPKGWSRMSDVVAAMPDAARDRLDMTSLLSRVLRAGGRIGVCAIEGIWGECDSPGDIFLYRTWIDQGRLI